jgi:hypothetical protein
MAPQSRPALQTAAAGPKIGYHDESADRPPCSGFRDLEAMTVLLSIVAALAAVAAAAAALAYRAESRPDRVLGLLYHRLVTDEQYAGCPPTEKIFSIPTGRFREQMEYLRDAAYTAVTLDAVCDYVEHGRPLPPRPVLVTFDDGCVSVYERALPILRALGFPALLFVTTDPRSWVFSLGSNAQRRVTDDEIRALDAAGVTIGSHAVSHEALSATPSASSSACSATRCVTSACR